MTSVPQQRLEPGKVLRRGNQQDVPDARQHQGGQRIVNHGLVIDGQQLLGYHRRQRVQTRAGASGQDDSLHGALPLFSYRPQRSTTAQIRSTASGDSSPYTGRHSTRRLAFSASGVSSGAYRPL